jgi:putative SOS response-associated peptidase YedK
VCGRYVKKGQAAIERAFSVVKPWWRFEPIYNVAPTQSVRVVRLAKGVETALSESDIQRLAAH